MRIGTLHGPADLHDYYLVEAEGTVNLGPAEYKPELSSQLA